MTDVVRVEPNDAEYDVLKAKFAIQKGGIIVHGGRYWKKYHNSKFEFFLSAAPVEAAAGVSMEYESTSVGPSVTTPQKGTKAEQKPESEPESEQAEPEQEVTTEAIPQQEAQPADDEGYKPRSKRK